MELHEPGERMDTDKPYSELLNPALGGTLPNELVVGILNWRTALIEAKAQERFQAGLNHWAGVAHEMRNLISDIKFFIPTLTSSSQSWGILYYWKNLINVPVFRKIRFDWCALHMPQGQAMVRLSKAKTAEDFCFRVPTLPMPGEGITYALRKKYRIPCVCCGKGVVEYVSRTYSKAKERKAFLCVRCSLRKCYEKGLFGIH